MIKFQAKRKDEVYELILDDTVVTEKRKFKNYLKAKAFFHSRKMRHKNNGWQAAKMEIPFLTINNERNKSSN